MHPDGPSRARVLLEPVQRRGSGDTHADALDLLDLAIDGFEPGRLAKPCQHVEVEAAARRIVADGRMISSRSTRVGYLKRPAQPACGHAAAHGSGLQPAGCGAGL